MSWEIYNNSNIFAKSQCDGRLFGCRYGSLNRLILALK
jgi:hypothetical protein